MPPFRLGVIGADTTHSIGLVRSLRRTDAMVDATGFVQPAGSTTGRDFSADLRAEGLTDCASVDELLADVDGVLLVTGTGDGRVDLVRAISAAGLPVFLDKPAALSMADLTTMCESLTESGTPATGASALRFADGVDTARRAGAVGAMTFGPSYLDPDHSDLFWYGVHGIELLTAALGPGCVDVTARRTSASYTVTAVWSDGRQGVYHGLIEGPAVHGGLAFTSSGPHTLGGFNGFDRLAQHVSRFFVGDEPPLLSEFVESHRIAEAARLSSNNEGRTVQLEEIADPQPSHSANNRES